MLLKKILISLLFLLLILLGYSRYEIYRLQISNEKLDQKIIKYKEQVSNLTNQVSNLTETLEKRNNDILAISKRQKELEQTIRNDTSGFNWNFDISSNPAIMLLQKQCKSCGK